MNKVIGLLLFAVATFSHADGQTSISTATVKTISAFTGDKAFIKTDPPAASTVSNCSYFSGEWALDLSTESRKAMYALILSAVSMGKTIGIYGGSGGCDVINNREAAVRVNVNY